LNKSKLELKEMIKVMGSGTGRINLSEEDQNVFFKNSRIKMVIMVRIV